MLATRNFVCVYDVFWMYHCEIQFNNKSFWMFHWHLSSCAFDSDFNLTENRQTDTHIRFRFVINVCPQHMPHFLTWMSMLFSVQSPRAFSLIISLDIPYTTVAVAIAKELTQRKKENKRIINKIKKINKLIQLLYFDCKYYAENQKL